MIKSAGIYGVGRFGKTLLRLLSPLCQLYLYDVKGVQDVDVPAEWVPASEACNKDALFLAVPIGEYENVCRRVVDYVAEETAIISVASVMGYPARIFTEQFSSRRNPLIITHPLFGPGSTVDGFSGKTVIWHCLRADTAVNRWLSDLFRSSDMSIVEMDPDLHDRDAARTQIIAHTLGRILDRMEFQAGSIRTPGVLNLENLRQCGLHISDELFHDMIRYNPFVPETIHQFQTICSDYLSSLS